MQKPYVIGICGGSGSGKTTIVDHVCHVFPKNEVSLLTQDDFYIPREEQVKDENGVVDFDRMTSIDHDAFHDHLALLIKGDSVSIKEYVFNNENAKAQMKTIDSAKIILVEGLFVFNSPKVSKLLDLKVFIDSSDVVKVIRRIKRDQIDRNYPLSDVLYRYEHHVLPSYKNYILPHKGTADIVINNNGDVKSAVNILTNLIKGILTT